MLSYKFRIYPSKTAQQKLDENLELCRWLYNKLLEELNKAKDENRKVTKKDTQAPIVKLKEENPKLNNVYSKFFTCYPTKPGELVRKWLE